MSGHSHAKTVKRTKEANAEKRGKIFSKIARVISVAAKDGGNVDFNPRLKQAIDEAKKANMPKDNVEKAIKKGTGELGDGQTFEEFTFEAIGPAGIALIIEGITDNKNRSLSKIKQILNKHNGKLANEGSLKWQFEKKGIIIINPKSKIQNPNNKETIELSAIEAGAEDIQWYQEEGEDFLEIKTKPEELSKVKKILEEQGLIIESANLGWTAKEKISVDDKAKESCQNLFEDLDENESVQNIYSNLAS